MAEYDGEVVIKARIETDDLQSDANKISKNLNDSFNRSSQMLSNLQKQYNDFVSGIMKTPEQLGIERALKREETELNKNISTLQQLEETYNIIKNSKGSLLDQRSIENFNRLEQQVNNLKERIKESTPIVQGLKERLNEVKLNPEAQSSVIRLEERINKLSNTVSTKLSSSFKNIGSGISKVFSGIGGALSSGFSLLASPIRSAIGLVAGLGRQILNIGKTAFILHGIRTGFRGISETISNVIASDNQFIVSLNQIKSNLVTAFYPIYQYILPALHALMNALSIATSYLAQFVAHLFGQNYKAMQEGARSFVSVAQSADSSATAVDKNKNSFNELGKSIKKSSKELASFDKLNVLNLEKKQPKAPKSPKQPKGGGGFAFTPTSNFDSTYSNMVTIFDKILDKLKPTIDAFKKLGDTIKDTFGEFVKRAGQDFYNDFLKPLGKWTVGKGLPEFARITENMFKNINWNKLNESLKGLWDALEPFAENIGEGLLWFYDNVLRPLGEYTVNKVLTPFLRILANVIKALDKVLGGVSDTFKWFFDTVISKLAEMAGEDLKNLLDFFDKLTGKVSNADKELNNFGQLLGSEAIGLGGTILAYKGGKSAISWLGKLAKAMKGTGAAAGGLSVATASIPTGILLVEIGLVIGALIDAKHHMDILKEAQKELFKDLGISEEEWKQKSYKEKADLIDQWLNLEKNFSSEEEKLRYERYRNELEISKDTMNTYGVTFDNIKRYISGLGTGMNRVLKDLNMTQAEWNKKSLSEQIDLLNKWLNEERTFSSEEDKLLYEQDRKKIEYHKNELLREQERREKIINFFKTLGDKAKETFDWLGWKAKELGNMFGNLFSNMWHSFTDGANGAFRAVLSSIQNRMNSWIKDLNWVIDSLRKFPGLGWLPSIPNIRIPGFAQGAVLKGGDPILAYLNDQPRGQTNIETPLNTMIDAFNTALENNRGITNNNIVVEASGDMDSIVSMLNFRIKQQDKITGSNFISDNVFA